MAMSRRIIHKVAQRFADGNFKGRLLLLPVANPPALEANSRNTPIDDVNMNRVFPGNADGWFTEQLAAAITESFLNVIDVYIDFHAGGDLATVDYIYILNDEALSRSFGSKVHYRPKADLSGTYYRGISCGITLERGIPTVGVELGGGRIDQSHYVERGVQGVINIMSQLDLIDSGQQQAPPGQIVVNEIAIIRPHHGGLMINEAPPLGEVVGNDAILGRVISPYTHEELEVIRNPFERGVMILAHQDATVMFPGCYGYMIGNMPTAEAS